ncbi:MAG: hypothetical protein FWF60_03580 [Oscillospiraceae bacterium]|nr:hypothetical protein [Oscillospiraceae bacterium]
MTKLREFFKANSDVVWPALCLFCCALAILCAALRRDKIHVEGDTGGGINILKNNHINITEIRKGA